MAKRLHYVCDPNLPVATKKRIRHSGLHLYFFSLSGGPRFLCESKGALALPYGKNPYHNICVPLAAARQLTHMDLAYLYVLDVTGATVTDHEAFCASVIKALDMPTDAAWHPPAGTERGSIEG